MKNGSEYEIIDGCLSLKNANGHYELILGYDGFSKFDKFIRIGKYAFAGRTIDKLYINDNIELIESYAFYFSNLNEAIISASKIDSYSFYYSNINALTISSKIIGNEAFGHVKNLTELVLAEGVKTISAQAFTCCFDLKKVYLPASLEKMETAAFIQCHKLTEVYYDLKQGYPVKLYAGNFIIYISNTLNADRKIDVKINDGFSIFVYENIYLTCISTWSNLPRDEHYVYHNNLTNFIKIRK